MIFLFWYSILGFFIHFYFLVISPFAHNWTQMLQMLHASSVIFDFCFVFGATINLLVLHSNEWFILHAVEKMREIERVIDGNRNRWISVYRFFFSTKKNPLVGYSPLRTHANDLLLRRFCRKPRLPRVMVKFFFSLCDFASFIE